MTSRNPAFTINPATGGLDTSSNPTSVSPNELIVAENIEYLEGGQRRKRLGTAAYNAAVMISTATNVRAVADFWRYGASLTPVQNFVAVAGASIFRSTGNGAFTAVTVASSFGVNTDKTTNITIAGDFAIFSDGTSTGLSYDQTTLAQLSAGHPIFTAGAYHLRRLWMVGISTSPSQVRFTAAGAVTTDSTGADSGSFLVNDGDGDALLGISQPFHKRLYFFKGQQAGSIHELAGATPSAFTLDKIATGAPILNHRSIVTTANDIYWLSRYGIHSLRTTVNYGDTSQAFLSLPIQKTFRDDIVTSRTDQAWGFWHPRRNIVGWFVVPGQQTTPLWALVYNYALSDPSPGGKKFWAIWTFTRVTAISGALMITPSVDATTPLQPRLYLGGADGVLYAGDQTTLGDNATTAYTARLRTPIITRLDQIPETQEKSFVGVVSYINPKGSYTANLNIIIDQRGQAFTIDLTTAGDLLTT